MKVKNPISSGKASGRGLGGVFSSNRGMETFKKYRKPHQPNTPEQQTVKTRFSFLTKYWEKSLTYEQITLWNNWNLPWTDIYGDPVLLTGMNKFVICNDTLLRGGQSMTDIPPTATPSEIIAVDTSTDDLLSVEVDGISNAEITAQTPFIQVKVLGNLQSISDATGIVFIKSKGISISRKPLKKNYKDVYYYLCRSGFEGVQEFEIQLDTINQPPTLQSIIIQRFNKWGYWSGPLTYTHPITILNLVKNGRLSIDADWLKSAGTTIHDGKAYFTITGWLQQNIPVLTVGKDYKIDFDLVRTGASALMRTWLGAVQMGDADASAHYSFTNTRSGVSKDLKFATGFNWEGRLDNVVLQ
ncbi:hypothetical protein KAH94_06485, partial [bacterium]|nr:hypothetical protein [bacterium]